MARSLGLPTRVAVGFTPGEQDGDGIFHVRGLNAHAWPEVWLDDFGWVAFEPTPGRGRPGAQEYTGVPESQANRQSPSTATTALPTTTTTAGPGGTTATTQRRDIGDSGGDGSSQPARANPAVRAVLVVLAIAAVWALVIPLLLRRRRLRRRSAAASGADRVLVAWAEAAEALGRVGAGRGPSETLHEYAQRVPGAVTLTPAAIEALRVLAGQAATASYAAGSLGAEAVGSATAAATTIEGAVAASAGWPSRVWWQVDPRPLLGSRERRVSNSTATSPA
jgi:hypothetical protein